MKTIKKKSLLAVIELPVISQNGEESAVMAAKCLILLNMDIISKTV